MNSINVVQAALGLVLQLHSLLAAEARAVIRLDTDQFLSYEPIVVDLQLTRSDEPKEQANGGRPATHNFTGHLVQGDVTVCEVYFGRGGLGSMYPSETQVSATLLGVLGRLTPVGRDSVFEFFATPGEYRLYVQDDEAGLKSNFVALRIVPGEARDLQAGRVFASGGRDVLLALQAGRLTDATIDLLKQVESRYDGTVFADYAGAVLDERRLDPVSLARITELPERCRVVEGISNNARRRFSPGHPLRSSAFLSLARLADTCTVFRDGNDPLTWLEAETKDQHFLKAAREIRESASHRR